MGWFSNNDDNAKTEQELTKTEKKAALARYRDLQNSLDEQAGKDNKAGGKVSKKFLRRNLALIEAETTVPWWRR